MIYYQFIWIILLKVEFIILLLWKNFLHPKSYLVLLVVLYVNNYNGLFRACIPNA